MMISIIDIPEEVNSIYIDNNFSRYMMIDEVKILCHIASKHSGNFLEIGCNKGLTTRDIAMHNGNKTIYALDYSGPNITMCKQQSLEKVATIEVCKYAVGFSNVRVINKLSGDFNYDSAIDIGVCFIDGDHTYNGVKVDTEKAIAHFHKRGSGVILWHDYRTDDVYPWLGVRQYLEAELQDKYDIGVFKGTNLAILEIK